MASASPETPLSAGRAPRSRLDRPCDICRRHKHLCVIPIRDMPCVSCQARKRPCTFDMPPTSRKRKKKDQSDEVDNNFQGLEEVPQSLNHVQTSPQQPDYSAQYTPQAGPSNWRETIGLSHGLSHVRMQPMNNTATVQALMQLSPSQSVYPASSPVNTNLQPVQAQKYQDPAPQDSLDLEAGEETESHFVGSGAFSGLALDPTAQSSLTSATLSFRQVSADPRLPAYFVKHKSLMYGRNHANHEATGRWVYEKIMAECEGIVPDVTRRALRLFRTVINPAFPYCNPIKLEKAFFSQGNIEPVPWILLAAVVSHCNVYIPELKPLTVKIWTHTLSGLDDDYRLPRLKTLQTVVILMNSRPAENAGQNSIRLSQAVGAAHVLGLHMDPSSWSLPPWERLLRKQLWWSLLIHDRWRALLFGRPSVLHSANFNVPIPSLDDDDWGEPFTASTRKSAETFVATCRLTMIIERVLSGFYTVEVMLKTPRPIERIVELEAIMKDLEDLETSLPDMLPWKSEQNMATAPLPTGIRSWQLSLFGIYVIVHRLFLDNLTDPTSLASDAAHQAAFTCGLKVVDLIAGLTSIDRSMFWMPYSPHHISNTVALLLRLAIRTKNINPQISQSAISETSRIVKCLLDNIKLEDWDIALVAVKRIATMLFMAIQELNGIKEVYKGVADVLGLPVPDETFSTDDFLASIGLTDLDPMNWFSQDLGWIDGDLWGNMGMQSFAEQVNGGNGIQNQTL